MMAGFLNICPSNHLFWLRRQIVVTAVAGVCKLRLMLIFAAATRKRDCAVWLFVKMVAFYDVILNPHGYLLFCTGQPNGITSAVDRIGKTPAERSRFSVIL